jgi:alpha-glucosidase (family GH31 glycosyl hydrolase)
VSGNARFEVLSPTLIRTEYAGDRAFVDASTFNAIGRDGFDRTRFTSRTVGGWLTIETTALTLRYRVGSGPFTDQNLTVTPRTGQQPVTATPWAGQTTPTCASGALCEAEDLALSGPAVATDHTGFTGRGFAAGFTAAGHSLTFDVAVATEGGYQLDTRYANHRGGDGQVTPRSLSVSVDGGADQPISLPATASWDAWAIASVQLSLAPGRHTVVIHRAAGDSGNVNLDSLAVVTPGTPYPTPQPPSAVDCRFGAICEAEAGTLAGGAKLADDHNGYSGRGFLAGLETTSASVTTRVTGVPRTGTYQVQLRYANAAAGAQPIQARTMSVRVGEAAPATTTLAPTSSWDSWRTVGVQVALSAGDNTVTLGCPDASGCHVNLDTLAVTTLASPLLAPHAPLGGYRRGLDGVNGSAITLPGLLYTDGWSLLVDTASAIYNPATRTVTQRPGHGGKPYQDGYVFGYGQDYQQALRDLTTLTGPSVLLPRWVYGIWYSEYYDRTAADYQNTILPRFRAEGVPLDVLVVDTDFKTPNQWNGWGIDLSKFPDPEAFFGWVRSEGLHSSLNIHPSILASDPQFERAQQIAKGKLSKGACSGGGADCYVFDFGDPDQLAAYLGLHSTMERQGVDFWWLDWCCDQAFSSLAGVTPDSWINQWYADAAAKQSGGRGFAFSRGYGSLQACGYGGSAALPTGPWADKRTTLHFTGDTTSSWESLRFEVGYTPGESVATGLAAVSHDIGGHTGGQQLPGSEPGSTRLPDDLYARWVQFGTFQPIDRLHSNHSDRLPWQYGPEAKASATKFLNLRENLVPYTYTLAKEASVTGAPIARPLYLEYPAEQEAYANAGSEYLYGPDVLVAPATTPGATATTSVWFPPGSSWTDYFTGRTYQGGSTHEITTTLDTMPVFIRSGGILTTRTTNVSNDEQNPLTHLTLTVAGGANGTGSLFEDDGVTADPERSATTKLRYRQSGATHQLTVDPAKGAFPGQVRDRTYTVSFTNATAPRSVEVNGRKVAATSWSWDETMRTLTVEIPRQSVRRNLVVSYR